MYIVTAYLLYIAISVVLTIWVARTLSKNGLVFLVDSFLGNRELATSVNHLLVVGFYLINLGYVLLALYAPQKPSSVQGVIEVLSSKLGVVMLVLGAMHFLNVDVHFALGALLDLGLQLVDFRSLAADDDSGASRVNADNQLVGRSLDIDAVDARGTQAFL